MNKCEFCGIEVGKKYHSCPEAREYRASMEKKPQHTPTPWKVTEIPSVDLWGKRSQQATVSDSKGKAIAVVGPNCEADAKFIVRAVNSHEILLAALTEIAAHAFNNTLSEEDAYAKIHDLAEDAIAKAEGK